MFRAVVDRVANAPGRLSPELRRAAIRGEALPAPIVLLAAKIRALAADVTDDDIATAQRAGYSDDQLFELTLASALGASATRLDAVLRALGRSG